MTDTIEIPGYKAGTWTVDPSHSEVAFSVRHMLISKVKGKFEKFDATFVTTENPLETKVTATADVASVNTNDKNRDGHLATNDFFDAPTHPELKFVSTGVRVENGDYKIDGDLTIKGVTKPVTFDFEFGGFGTDAYGNYKAGFEAKTEIDRNDFGVNWNAALETGGVLVGDKVTISLDVQAVLSA
ncbi:YceI family protein [Herbiconiux flava]|uniref:Polyisoprenoid-binding protein YceI n=1 Tax=Herbiconiux flava TaxID=881268 RepID=A0A852SQM0_9MICO|nr:YceI family protein [Herbiconiux flava]NYD71131.1 polyisoprenoid-binding protein YceI [Herbiconiux flava]GLK18907.1 polyisoprenoid-binding protein [Herbiconiux flava]